VGGRPIPREVLTDHLAGVLLDVDGTLLTETGPIPGAAAVVARLRHRGFPFRILTNITRRSRQSVVDRLRRYGIAVEREEVFTAVYAGADWMQRRGVRRLAPFVTDDALEDLRDFELVGGTAGPRGGGEEGASVPPRDRPPARPDAVLIGDVGERWTHALLNEAFRYVMGGAQLVALQMGRYWQGPSGLEVDAGAYVTALEYATGAEATVCGKPNREFFEAAIASLREPARRNGPTTAATALPPIAMVGDDLWADIDGAQQAGLEGWLVRTGKFHEDTLATSGIRPDRVLDSVAELC
jgi:HAD superfamily hydrolase (TIGR01450 family)